MPGATYLSQLIDRKPIASGTMSFFFKKPKGFTFLAGQQADFTLINPSETDTEGNKRTFTLASAPSDDFLMIATRMRDTAFKRQLKSMSLPSEIQIQGPAGVMTLHNDMALPAVFLAGGIGITPFLSMLRDATHRSLPHRIFLFYSNRRPEDAAFLSELQDHSKKNSHLTLVPTFTNMDESNETWSGKTGYITPEMIREAIGDSMKLQDSMYYMAGPETFTKAMRETLTKVGVGIDHFRFETFTGYEKQISLAS